MNNLISKLGKEKAERLKTTIEKRLLKKTEKRMEMSMVVFKHIFVIAGGNMILAWSEDHDRATISIDGVTVFSVTGEERTYH